MTAPHLLAAAIDVSTPHGRLEYLPIMLDDVEAMQRPFGLQTWWGEDNETPHDCGTPACAMGWACRDPVFQAQGLGVHSWGSGHGYAPKFGIYLDFAATEAFFGISSLEARLIFLRGSYAGNPTAADVAARVRTLLGRDGA